MAGIKLSAEELNKVEPLEPGQGAKSAPIKLTQADMAHVEPVDETEPAFLKPGKGIPGSVETRPVKNTGPDLPGQFKRDIDAISPDNNPVSNFLRKAIPDARPGEFGKPRNDDPIAHDPIAQMVVQTPLMMGAGAVAKPLGAIASGIAEGVTGSATAGETSAKGLALGAGLGVLGRGAAGELGDKIGSLERSDRRLLNQVTDGARAKLRTKLERTELADNAALIRNDPSLLKSVKDPAQFKDATANRLSKNRANADAIGADVRTETHEMVKALREKQEKLRGSLATEEMADAMEGPIKKLEARAKRLDEAAKTAPPASAPTTPKPPGKYESELERFNHEDPGGFDYLEPSGKVTATSEQATAAGKRGPVAPSEPTPPVAEPPKGEPYRDVRQYITNRQDKAFDYMPGAKPSAKNKAHQEIADTVREVLHGKVAATSPEALPALKQLDSESSILARMNKIAEYKHVNSPAFNTSRLTTAMKNNRGVLATGKAGVKYVFASADEALAAIARANKSGKPVPKSMFQAARDAGVKAGTINMIMTKLNRDDNDEETGTE